MIAQWHTYSIQDFIPFTEQVYLRQIEWANETLWPLQLAMICAGIGIIYLTNNGWMRCCKLLLAGLWFWVGIVFLFQHYADLWPLGFWFGWAFCLQGLLLSGLAMAGSPQKHSSNLDRVSMWIGLPLMIFGLLVYPPLTAWSNGGWMYSEIFGIHPDPTAIVTLGIILLFMQKNKELWGCAVIPVIWCVTSGLTLWGLEASLAMVPPIAAAFALTGIFRKSQLRELN